MKKVASLLSAFVLCLTVSASASYCTYCGKGFNDSANFCSNCGTRLYKQTTNSVVTSNGNTTKNSTTTCISPNNTSSTITYTTPGYSYTTSTCGNTQVIYTNPPVVSPAYVYPTSSTVVYRSVPTFGEILIGGVLAHQIYKHHHRHHHVHRPATVVHRYGPRPHHR